MSMNEDQGQKTEKVFASAGPIWSVIAGFVVALLALIFILQNTASVKVNFLWLHGNVPLAILLLVVAFAAIAVDELAGVYVRFRRRRERNRAEKLKNLQAQ